MKKWQKKGKKFEIKALMVGKFTKEEEEVIEGVMKSRGFSPLKIRSPQLKDVVKIVKYGLVFLSFETYSRYEKTIIKIQQTTKVKNRIFVMTVAENLLLVKGDVTGVFFSPRLKALITDDCHNGHKKGEEKVKIMK
jgi:hypothetical protein